MSINLEFGNYLESISNSSFKASLGDDGGYITFENSGKRGLKSFTLSISSFLTGLIDIKKNLGLFSSHVNYSETEWRNLGELHFSDLALSSSMGVQTKPTFTVLSKIICWANNLPYNDETIKLDEKYLDLAIIKLEKLIKLYVPRKTRTQSSSSLVNLPKAFLLLAGISGTGKSRFVREQVSDSGFFCSVAVRPDWHEPSDLLGYVSRLSGQPEYHVTDVLTFIVKAWINACDFTKTTENELANRSPVDMKTYWLCLDEMNLAPVEQYFADYLSVIETRKWDGDIYTCDPLLKAAIFTCIEPDQLVKLRNELELGDDQYDPMWSYFTKIGIPVPPNLIVAGTVNMDETTHGFSRKVIDRALTFDFGKFFPNDFDHYLNPTVRAKSLSFPTLSSVSKEDLAALSVDADGLKTIQFCKDLNEILKDSSFELAFRALNELLISLICANPTDEAQLQAVWDDFLMTKVLPRVEGDTDKLSVIGKDESILSSLELFLEEAFSEIKSERIDFFREDIAGNPLKISCRSIGKIKWMQQRLDKSTFTSFWP